MTEHDSAVPADQAPLLVEETVETVRMRRAPKVTVFLVLGGALGILVAMVLTFAFGDGIDKSIDTGMIYSQGQVFGFLALICVSAGVALGGFVAIVLDRVSRHRARDVVVDRESITTTD